MYEIIDIKHLENLPTVLKEGPSGHENKLKLETNDSIPLRYWLTPFHMSVRVEARFKGTWIEIGAYGKEQ